MDAVRWTSTPRHCCVWATAVARSPTKFRAALSGHRPGFAADGEKIRLQAEKGVKALRVIEPEKVQQDTITSVGRGFDDFYKIYIHI